MYLLDTNAFELLIAGEPNTLHRLAENAHRVWLSSVAAEEFLVARLSGMNRARSARTSLSLPQAHEDFVLALTNTQLLPLFSYSADAEAVYRAFPPAIIRIGAQDCRIAAQAVAHGLTVVTRNVRDFEAIGAACVDWSATGG